MRKFVLLFILSILVFALNAEGWRLNEMEVRVFYNNQSELAKLAELRLNGDIYPNGEALLFVIPSELEMIKSTGLRYKIEREDLNEFSRNFWQSMDPTRVAYHTYEEIVALADSLAATFPDICEKHMFGTSVQGRELGALKISDNVSLDENEAEVMFDGGIHGDEVGCSENCIRFARDLCRDYSTDPYIADLIDNREIWIYYSVNPDGRVADSRYNANGVDLNRDAGYMWDGWGGSSGAFSQVESKALRDATYGRQFVVHTTYHSGTEFISCPWSYRADQCPDFGHILQLAGIYSSTSGYANMQYGQGCTGMYPINGSTKDTNYGAAGSISWSMEISYDKDPPTSQIMMFYNYNKPAMLAMIEYSGYGLEGIVTDVNTGDPVTAAVFINDYFPLYTDPAVGDYHKYVLPGTYNITIVANGYETQTITGVTVTSNSSITTDFQLTPQDGQFVYRICSSHIPDNNTADEGDTPGVIGAPDNRNYSIGKDGWVVLDMQFPVIDGPGNDVKIYEGDTSPEGYDCYASETIDGPWQSLGAGNGTTEFDLAIGGLIDAQFIKIVDDGDGSQTAPDAGFDLDAIESISDIAGVYIALLGYEIDEMIGNNNGFIDPGETIDMLVSIRNNGTQLAEDVIGLLSTTSTYVFMNNDDVDFGDLNAGQTGFGIFTFTVDTVTPIGELLAFNLNITANAGTYSTDFGITCVVGIMIEDFENNNFLSFDWEFGGNADWITTTGAYEGMYCAKSGSISHNQSTSLTLTADVVADGEISFYRKVSSEANYDYLRFYVDNTQLGSWSGTSGWNQETYPVSAGNHTFKWEYTKDVYVSTGDDCGWIDYIVFPPISTFNIGTVEGTVTDIDTGLPIEGADISGLALSGPDGTYTFDIAPGTHNFTCTADGYYDLTIEDVEVITNQVVIVDFEMEPVVILYPPQNLTATVIDYNSIIRLTWSIETRTKTKIKNQRELIGFNVYYDGSLLGFTPGPPFDFIGPFAPGDYSFMVTAVYDEGESEPAEVVATVVLNPPENLVAMGSGSDVILTWEPPIMVRGLDEYKIYKNDILIGTTTDDYYIDTDVLVGIYTYGVSALYAGGYESDPIEIIFEQVNTENPLIPISTALIGNYPNPFNPETTISFALKAVSDVTLNIYNTKGQKVKTILADKLNAGYHDVVWNGRDDNNQEVTSGIYFMTLDAVGEIGRYTSVKKIVLMK
ncbi:MAG: carboxypeptidase regulatory-like domain-containing protein [Armatimonadetes bacterium]|nr:carboxypeptidase regulatory-like domain-containing protein [Armatimonadota bacterium]